MPSRKCLGGILADEMGLGKTVEVLATILLNPKPGTKPATPYVEAERHDVARQFVVDQTNANHGDTHTVSAMLEEIVSDVASRLDTDSALSLLRAKRKRAHTSERQPKAGRKNRKKTNQTEVKTSEETFAAYSGAAKSRMFAGSGRLSGNINLECTCGQTSEDVCSEDVTTPLKQCSDCGSYQHVDCVGWSERIPISTTYRCPHCAIKAEPVLSRGTLIISPAAICHQWYLEIKKHIRGDVLNIHIYEGIAKEGFIQPHLLADNDVVITTYETLRSEMHYLDLPHNSRFRHPKRFMACPSPLVAVNWWRICLDEAQMVECTSSSAAAVCRRLSGVHRWCITGTPIQKSVNDLYGLFVFLDYEPYCVKWWWDACLWVPFTHGNTNPLFDVTTDILWRNNKIDVYDQLGIPGQIEKQYSLDFSPIEDHFYRRLHEECASSVTMMLRNYTPQYDDMRLMDLSRTSIQVLMRPLLRLRQACCHPQVAKGSHLSGVSGSNFHSKKDLTMADVLTRMIDKTVTESEDAHRAQVVALNGRAGIAWLRSDYPTAAELYREVLTSDRLYGGTVRTDPLTQLHTCHNLTLLLEESPTSLPRATGDDDLMNKANQVKTDYLMKSRAVVIEKAKADEKSEEDLKKLVSELGISNKWWANVNTECRELGLEPDLLERVLQAQLSTKGTLGDTWIGRIQTVNGLNLLIESHTDRLNASRSALVEGVKNLSDALTEETGSALNMSALECHLRPVGGKLLNTCLLCRVDALFDDYECRLYNFDKTELSKNSIETVKGIDDEDVRFGTLRHGTWSDSCVERALKAIVAFLRSHSSLRHLAQLLDAGSLHLKIFEAKKKEFRASRAHWIAIRDHVAAWDEVNMATERLTIRQAETDEVADSEQQQTRKKKKKKDTPLSNFVYPWELGALWQGFKMEQAMGQKLLVTKLAQLQYLRTLEAKSAATVPDAPNDEECPVCRSELGHSWAVVDCGHCYCAPCLKLILHRLPFTAQRFTCPLCRQQCARANISFVSTQSSRRDPNSGQSSSLDHLPPVDVNGGYSTKVEAIVRCLVKIRINQPSAKVLVFSAWNEVLRIISNALLDNTIPHTSLANVSASSSSGFALQRHLQTFKTSPELHVLLIPLASGANGLNIVEASHVILAEPSLNLAAEEQAIGRIHRIGQRQVTFVHRFFIRGAIEEKLFKFNAGSGPNKQHAYPACSSNTIDKQQHHPDHLETDLDLTIKEFQELFALTDV